LHACNRQVSEENLKKSMAFAGIILRGLSSNSASSRVFAFSRRFSLCPGHQIDWVE